MTDNIPEEHLLGCLLLQPDLVLTCELRGVTPVWFQHDLYRRLYRAIVDRYNEKGEIDIVWASEVARTITGKSHPETLSHLIANILSPTTECASAIEILELRQERGDLQRLLTAVQRDVYLKEPAMLREYLITELQKQSTDDGNQNIDLVSVIDEKISKGIEVSTGYHKLDHLINGLERGAYITIGGYTTHGKSLYTQNIALDCLTKDVSVTMFSTEMRAENVVGRLATMMTGINFKPGVPVDPYEKDEYLTAVKRIAEMPLYFTRTFALSDIRHAVRQKKSYLYIVDYIQDIVTEPGVKENIRLLNVVTELYRLAKDYQVCIIAVSQFSRPDERDTPKTPNLFRFYGSGGIEQRADICIILNHPFQLITDPDKRDKAEQDGKENLINVGVYKNKLHGIHGIIKCELDRQSLRIKEIEE